MLVATAGNYLGACTTYWRARYAAERGGARATRRAGERRRALIARYGPPALLLSWVPLIGDALVALAGCRSHAFPGLLDLDSHRQGRAILAVAWIVKLTASLEGRLPQPSG